MFFYLVIAPILVVLAIAGVFIVKVLLPLAVLGLIIAVIVAIVDKTTDLFESED